MKHAVKHIHFVGIGGAGMSGIAEILHNLGYAVSGSDQSDSATTRRLASLGIRIHVGHDSANIAGAEAVVTSTAVRADNPEVIAARAMRMAVLNSLLTALLRSWDFLLVRMRLICDLMFATFVDGLSFVVFDVKCRVAGEGCRTTVVRE